MALQQEQHAFRGMQRDLTISKFSPEYFFDARNIRITAREHDTLLSITNEKGNSQMSIRSDKGGPLKILGTVLGYTTIKNIAIIFTTEGVNASDHIYKLTFNTEVSGGKFDGYDLLTLSKADGSIKNLNIGLEETYPIEAIGIYENEKIQKVYWVDGKNQPRMINIVESSENRNRWTESSFDFAPEIELKDNILVEASETINGVFSSGVVQYAYTYIHKYGTETPIVNTSGLMYVSYPSRGASPEDKVSMGFGITLENLDTNFEFVRLYSTHRASIDGPVSARRIVDIRIPSNKTIYYVDTNTIGETVDATELLYKGGEDLVANTITNKDNVLFLGNITLNKKPLTADIKKSLKDAAKGNASFELRFSEQPNPSGFYPYTNSLYLGAINIKHFKRREWYRFGIQFQYKTGQWSEVAHLTDLQLSDKYLENEEYQNKDGYYIAVIKLPNYVLRNIFSLGYKRARLAVVYPSESDRDVVCQGMLCPTVFNIQDRYSGDVFSQSSWFARAFPAFSSAEAIRDNWLFSKESTVIDSVKGIFNHTLFYKDDNTALEEYNTVAQGDLPAYTSHALLADCTKRNGEIQCNLNTYTDGEDVKFISTSMTRLRGTELIKAVSNTRDMFMVDSSILTLHSPDIEFNDSMQNMESDTLKLRIVGVINLTSFNSDLDIQTSTPAFSPNADEGYGFYKEFIGVSNTSQHGGALRLNSVSYIDSFFGDTNLSDVGENKNNYIGYFVYPWHANRSLINQSQTTDKYQTKYAMLDKKKLSNLRFSSYNCLFKNAYDFEVENDDKRTGISGVRIWNSKETGIIRVPAPKNSGLSDFNYSGNIDKIITFQQLDYTYKLYFRFPGRECNKTIKDPNKNVNLNRIDGYPIMISNRCQTNANYHNIYTGDPMPIIKGTTTADSWDVDSIINTHGTEPIRMKYKSTPHAVLSLNYTNESYLNRSVVLPATKYRSYNGMFRTMDISASYSSSMFFWNPKLKTNESGRDGIWQDVIPESSYFSNLTPGSDSYPHNGFSYLFLGELYRDNVKNRFGGDTEEAFQNNMWTPMPDKIQLSNSTSGVSSLYATVGDTFYQRYDCLKTYPFTLEDQNSIVDIVSFKVETRINLDGRYDKNRGQMSNLVMTPENFNKMNPVYDQQDSFWTFRGLDTDSIQLNEFSNAIIWTKEKVLGGDIDEWTQLNLASILYLSGEKGAVTSLNTYNNEIYAFQEHGLSHLLYNARVQIPASDGVPIEITNGTKMGGSIYMSEIVGCSNKWSIIETTLGLYFIDNSTNAIYLFNGQLDNLSDRLGFKQWIGENNSTETWDPKYKNNFRTFYDWNNGDIYFTLKDTALCYSEHLGQFTSFMDYGGIPAMFNINEELFSIDTVLENATTVSRLWKQFAGDYNMFYGVPKPYSVTFISNANPTADKIFNVLEFRADNWSKVGLVERTFDTLEVWNEYQRGIVELTNKPGFPSPLKRKFRIWRALIPRDNKNRRDRMRNTWLNIKLSKEDVSENRDRVVLHDATVHYFA